MEKSELCRSIVEHAPDAILFADAEGLIRLWNDGAERMFGYAVSEALGQSLDLIIPEKLRKRHWDGYNQTMASGVTRYGAESLLSVPALRKDGSRISVEFTILPLRDRDGALCGIAAILRDVTATFNELKSLRQQVTLEQPWRAKDG